MNTLNFPPATPSGYLTNGTAVFDLRDVAAAHGLTPAGCAEAFDDFTYWMSRLTGGIAMLQAGVMLDTDPRIHRVQ